MELTRIARFTCLHGSTSRKTSTSHLANKKRKALLSNAAASAVQHDPQLKVYYHRKLDEGKDKMVVLNAVMAKLINRVFATVSRGTHYVPIARYGQAA